MADAEHAPWALIVDPCYTEKRYARELNLTVSALDTLADALGVLRLETADGFALDPAFQLLVARAPSVLLTVLLGLQAGVDDPWTWARCLNGKFSVTRSIETLWAGELDSVLRDAR